jgi:LytR cell envelope-related transcriptional attenuator
MKRQGNLWLLLIVVVCAVSFFVGRGTQLPFLDTEPNTESSAEIELVDDTDPSPVHLLILNGTDRSGLAREVSRLVTRVGCVAENVGNAPTGDHPASLLVNRRLDSQRARDLAARLGGVCLLTEWDDRGTEDAVLLLGEDYSNVLTALDR